MFRQTALFCYSFPPRHVWSGRSRCCTSPSLSPERSRTAGAPGVPAEGTGAVEKLWLQSKPRERMGEQRLRLSSTWVPCASVTARASTQPVTLPQRLPIPAAPWPQVPEPSPALEALGSGEGESLSLNFRLEQPLGNGRRFTRGGPASSAESRGRFLSPQQRRAHAGEGKGQRRRCRWGHLRSEKRLSVGLRLGTARELRRAWGAAARLWGAAARRDNASPAR